MRWFFFNMEPFFFCFFFFTGFVCCCSATCESFKKQGEIGELQLDVFIQCCNKFPENVAATPNLELWRLPLAEHLHVCLLLITVTVTGPPCPSPVARPAGFGLEVQEGGGGFRVFRRRLFSDCRYLFLFLDARPLKLCSGFFAVMIHHWRPTGQCKGTHRNF